MHACRRMAYHVEVESMGIRHGGYTVRTFGLVEVSTEDTGRAGGTDRKAPRTWKRHAWTWQNCMWGKTPVTSGKKGACMPMKGIRCAGTLTSGRKDMSASPSRRKMRGKAECQKSFMGAVR